MAGTIEVPRSTGSGGCGDMAGPWRRTPSRPLSTAHIDQTVLSPETMEVEGRQNVEIGSHRR